MYIYIVHVSGIKRFLKIADIILAFIDYIQSTKSANET